MAKSLIKPVEIDFYGPSPDKPGMVRLTGHMTHQEFAKQVKANLKALGMDGGWEWLNCQSTDSFDADSCIIVGLRRGNESPMIEVMDRGKYVMTIKHFGPMSDLLAIIEAIYLMLHETPRCLARRYPAPVEDGDVWPEDGETWEGSGDEFVLNAVASWAKP